MPMTSFERIRNIFRRQPIDRIGVHEAFWSDTIRKWIDQGHLKPGESLEDYFDFDLSQCRGHNYTPIPDFVPVTLAEDEGTITQRDANGAILRRPKGRDGTPEHVAFTVKCRDDWERLIKPRYAKPDPARINFDAYRNALQAARRKGRFFCWNGINVFEQMHPIIGHETMLMAMIDDPDWILDMVATLARMNIEHQELLYAKEGLPDGVWYSEDMGFRDRPFISPGMYRQFLQPAHIQTIRHAHDRGLLYVMHSCGYVEPLIPDLIEAGIDCLQALEVKAGMDLLRIHKTYGERLSLMGGIDARTLCSNDLAAIDRELQAKIPHVKKGFGYCLQSDHSIPYDVEYDTYRHFVRQGLQLGTY